MDRLNGRWVLVPASFGERVKRAIDDSVHDDPAVDGLRDQLREAGIGADSKTSSEEFDTLILKLTNACNYSCTYCYDFEVLEKATKLDFDILIKAIDQGLELCNSELAVILHGGEPTLLFGTIKQLILKAEEIAADKGKQIRFIGQTNLSKLNEDMVDFSRSHGISWGISLDGDSNLNDRFRIQRSGESTYVSFERAYVAFPEFVRSCGVMSTITSANHNQLLSVARHFKTLQMRSWDWSLFQPTGRGKQFEDLLSFSIDALVVAWNELFDAVLEGEFDGFPVRPITKYINNFYSGPGNNMCMRRSCGAARDLLSISANGTVEACDCIDPSSDIANLGNLREHSLEQAYNSKTADVIRSRDVTLGHCSECIWLAVCGGTCLAYAYPESGIHGKSALLCALSMNAFNRIAEEISKSGKIERYLNSLDKREHHDS